jgi:hypothetical protein
MDASFWDSRYSTEGYIYGVEPNEFLAEHVGGIPSGPVLCLADGEGRNGVFVARHGHEVTSVDQSAVALEKAKQLAQSRHVELTTHAADLSDYEIAPGAWAGVVTIFMHLPPALRHCVLARAEAGLKSGGVFLLECYTPAQVGRGTGGPSDPLMCPTLAALRAELPGLNFKIGRELERNVVEGAGHSGIASVVQVLARKP